MIKKTAICTVNSLIFISFSRMIKLIEITIWNTLHWHLYLKKKIYKCSKVSAKIKKNIKSFYIFYILKIYILVVSRSYCTIYKIKNRFLS